MRLSAIVAAGALALAAALASPTAAAAHEYQVGDIVIYHNPYDGTPERKGRVTQVDDSKIWVDFKEFQPGLNIAEASKILWKNTNAVDDFLHPADGAAPPGGAPADGAPPPVPAGPPAGGGGDGGFPTMPPPGAANLAQPAGCAPAAQQASAGDVFGTWSTLQIGHTVNYAPGDGYIYQKQEIGAQAGNITIKPDGTFVWNSKSEGVIRGHWRAATEAELRGGFGASGIRLLKGESGWDYNVQRRPHASPNAPDSIAIWTSGYQVNGYRVR